MNPSYETIVDKHAAYSQRHMDQSAAKAYQKKFTRSLAKRLSAAREMRVVAKALDEAVQMAGGEPALLDYPCGAGRFAKLFAGRAGAYLAGDHSPHMVGLAAEVVRGCGLGGKLVGTVVNDLRKTGLDDGCVDIVACMRLLHHFPGRADRVAILAELRRVSRGPLLVSFLDAGSAKQRWHRWRRRVSGREVTRVLVTVDEFEKEAGEAGWAYVRSWQLSSVFSGICVALLRPV